jgi:hypothetical protein
LQWLDIRLWCCGDRNLLARITYVALYGPDVGVFLSFAAEECMMSAAFEEWVALSRDTVQPCVLCPQMAVFTFSGLLAHLRSHHFIVGDVMVKYFEALQILRNQ